MKITISGGILEIQVPFKSCLKNPVFWSTKIQISSEPLVQI